MTEEEEKPDSGIPEWQRSQEDTEDNSTTTNEDITTTTNEDITTTTNEDITTTTNEDRIKVARRFLDDEKIKTSPRESKIAFLRGKGIDEADIKELLGEVEFSQPLASAADEPSTSAPIHSSSESVLSNRDRAPIVTYPEFLTPKAESSPPLLTRNRLVIILQLFAFISTLVVGSSRFILRPMLDRLTDSRIDLYTSTSKALAPLLSKLEKSVSQVPPRIKTRNDSDQDSDSDDPSEMFHHDVGTQTSTPLPLSRRPPW
uniref:Peroxisomal membrane protein PEX14 n=1 Tax=Bionectria ochroleuca TaxID=29856 RepID=A0A8H7KCR0_BIOOC